MQQRTREDFKHVLGISNILLFVCMWLLLAFRQMEEDANEVWLFGQGFLNPSQKWSMRHVCQLSQKQQRGRNVIWKLGTASSENAIFHCENMARETMCSGSRQAGWSNRIKRAVLFLREMLRKDAHSFVPQLFHLLQHKECLWSQCGKVWGFLTSHGSWSLGLARLHLSSVSPVISPLSSNDPFTCISFDKGLQSLTHNLEVQILWKPRVCNSFIVQHDPITFGSKSWHEWSYNYS